MERPKIPRECLDRASEYAETWQLILDRALEDARGWCEINLHKNLPLYVREAKMSFDYDVFFYIINNYDVYNDDPNERIEADMRVIEKVKGQIQVSTAYLEFYQRLEYGRRMRKLPNVEVDPESVFVHEIAEDIIARANPRLKSLHDSRLAKTQNLIHQKATEIENINRRERGLKDVTPQRPES